MSDSLIKLLIANIPDVIRLDAPLNVALDKIYATMGSTYGKELPKVAIILKTAEIH